jgi:Mce-associated membrane protein
MSPRRKIQPGEEPLLIERSPRARQWAKPTHDWITPLAMATAVLLAAGAITTSSIVLKRHESHHTIAVNEVGVLDFVQAFMAHFTSLDPFHANDWLKQTLDDETNEFAKPSRDKQNEYLIGLAQAEKTKGNILAAGVEKRYADGSFQVIVATEIKYRSPDQKQKFDIIRRWVVVAKQEGGQWKISDLQPVT